jgi:hypothetical protein
MPSWERFKELVNLRFGPAIRYNRLSELVRLPFQTSSVKDYHERFNALVCYNPQLMPSQKADLFVGGLPELMRAHLRRGAWHILVKWHGLPVDDATWEPPPQFQDLYLTFSSRTSCLKRWGEMTGVTYQRRAHASG